MSSRDSPQNEAIIWHSHRSIYSLGVAVGLTEASLELERDGDDLANLCAAVGTSPLRAAAWLRSRGAAVGHAASKDRLTSAEGAVYEHASQKVISRSGKTALTFGEVRSSKIARWIAPNRVAIVLVGTDWPTCHGSEIHAVVVVAAGARSLHVFDPAGDGATLEYSFKEMDATRSAPSAAWEVLLAERRG